jgi:Uma2 family endonuclease
MFTVPKPRDPSAGLYAYPDVTVVCGPSQFVDREDDTLLNPTVLFEVASETTAAYDRGPKARQYLQLDTLQQRVLVAQDEPHVEVDTRQPDGEWKLSQAAYQVESLAVASIGASLALAEVYRGVEFPPRDEKRNPAAIG